MTATIGEYFSKRRGLANGIAFSGASTGGLIFAPIMSALFQSYGYSGTLLIVAGMTLNICVTGMLLRPIQWFEKRLPKQVTAVTELNDKDILLTEKEPLVTRVLPEEKQATDNLEANNDQDKNGSVGNKSVLHLRNNHVPRFVRSGSYEPQSQTGPRSPSASPMFPRARTSSLGNRRQRTISEKSESSVHKTVTRMNSVLDSLSSSKMALYASTDCVCASVVDIREIQTTDEDTPPQPSCCSRLKKSFDLSLFKNPVFPTFLIMAGLSAASCLLTPAFLVPHAKDVGLSTEQRGFLLSIVSACGLTSRLTCGFIADKKFVKLTTILACASILMGTMAHLLRLFSGFGSFVALAICIGKYIFCSLCGHWVFFRRI